MIKAKIISGRKEITFQNGGHTSSFPRLLLEMSLRIFHYGNDLELFVEARNHPGYLVLNPSASKRYFINESFAQPVIVNYSKIRRIPH
jgi:hypothetical protein